MIKKSLILCLLLLGLVMTTTWAQGGGMSDKEVMEYVEMSMQQGKSQQQIATELTRRGVSRAQAERVKRLYEQNLKNGKSNSTTKNISRSRLSATEKGTMGVHNNEKIQNIQFISNQEISATDSLKFTVDKNGNLVSNGITIYRESKKDTIYGRNIFNTTNLTFEPSTNLPTPSNYLLGSGDEIIIDIWGTNETSIKQTISPDGVINIEGLGLVFLNGLTIEKATSYLRKELNKIYGGLSDENPTSHIKVSLGNSRTIQVNVMGEVLQPGTYALSAFSTVFHALYSAGGVSEIGSLRKIQVVRNGKNIATVDVYDFIMQGKTKDDINLQEGDVIIVPPYEALVKIEGNVKRPMKYEMKNRRFE
jgi:protein involved in polysaccharide export with SLBB domain